MEARTERRKEGREGKEKREGGMEVKKRKRKEGSRFMKTYLI